MTVLDGNADWSARVECSVLVPMGLRDPQRLHCAAGSSQRADETDAAWRLGLLLRSGSMLALRAFRIPVEAVP